MIINGHKSYDNTLIMKGRLKWDWVVVGGDDWLDLPSLTKIDYLGDCKNIHYSMGRVILEGNDLIWFDLIWFE